MFYIAIFSIFIVNFAARNSARATHQWLVKHRVTTITLLLFIWEKEASRHSRLPSKLRNCLPTSALLMPTLTHCIPGSKSPIWAGKQRQTIHSSREEWANGASRSKRGCDKDVRSQRKTGSSQPFILCHHCHLRRSDRTQGHTCGATRATRTDYGGNRR